MILSDRDILAAMRRERDPLVIDPPVPDNAIQPASVDVTLGETIYPITCPDSDGQRYICTSYELAPEECLLGTTAQTIHVPTDMVAQITGKSSLGRLFLTIHATAGFIDPGFKGQVTLELRNNGPRPIMLDQGMTIGQLVFTRLTSPAFRPYGTEGLGSHYQGQVGATRSYLDTSN